MSCKLLVDGTAEDSKEAFGKTVPFRKNSVHERHIAHANIVCMCDDVRRRNFARAIAFVVNLELEGCKITFKTQFKDPPNNNDASSKPTCFSWLIHR